jgi:hypothetical protein
MSMYPATKVYSFYPGQKKVEAPKEKRDKEGLVPVGSPPNNKADGTALMFAQVAISVAERQSEITQRLADEASRQTILHFIRNEPI